MQKCLMLIILRNVTETHKENQPLPRNHNTIISAQSWRRRQKSKTICTCQSLQAFSDILITCNPS